MQVGPILEQEGTIGEMNMIKGEYKYDNKC